MSYLVKEIFYSLQGEGFHSGRPAIFCRMSKCNLWTGREKDRAKAICQFCDTNFIGTDGQNGGKFTDAETLCQHLLKFWPTSKNDQIIVDPFVVITGGEPLLQVDQQLIEQLHQHKFEIAIETNGTQKAPPHIDWICMSPKANAPIILDTGDELKLVYPQANLMPEKVKNLNFDYFYLQPMDNQDSNITQQNIKQAVAYCLGHPQWKLSLQTQKFLNIY